MAAAGWTSRVPRESGLSYHALFAPLGQWDAVWYRWIAEHGYDPAIGHGNAAAFFPLYPLTWRVVGVLPGPMTLWGSLLSSAALRGRAVPALPVTQGRYDERMARRTVLYLAIFPLTFVFSLPYAESLFLLLALGAFVLTWHGRWWWGCRPSARWPCSPGRWGSRSCPPWRGAGTGREGLRWRAYLPLLLHARGRARLLPLPGLAHGQLHGQPRCPGARLGPRRLDRCRGWSSTRSGTTCSRAATCAS